MHKRVGYAELLNSKLRSDNLIARQDALRRSKLKAFLEQHQHASQWAQCVAALKDAARHNVTPTSEMMSDAIQRCGLRGKLDVAKSLYKDFHHELGKPRTPQVHIAFMAACADCADFAEAHAHFTRLRDRDLAMLTKNASHRPIVGDELTCEYLRAALEASRISPAFPHESPTALDKDPTAGEGAPSSSVALQEFRALRAGPLRPYTALTPVLLERVALLLEFSRDWAACLRLLTAAQREAALIPPEAHDAAIRACYRSQRHSEVVALMQSMIAARSPPDERSVRLATASCEEVAARASRYSATADAAAGLAVCLLDAMRRNGIMLRQPMYEAPLRCCVFAGRWEAAVKVLETMRQDHRPIAPQIYRLVLAARVEACESVEEAMRIAQTPAMRDGGAVTFMALLRCCMRLRDWKGFDRINREMRSREVPETFDKMRLLIEAAHMREQWHSVLMRFARFESVTGYEKRRVEEDGVVRMHSNDFDIPDALVDMVLEAYEHVRDHKDPVVHEAYRAALRRKEKGIPRVEFSSQTGAPVTTPPADWMFSRTVREESGPSQFF